jgi:type III secretion protein J
MKRSQTKRWLLCVLLLISLSACKVELRTGLSEDEGNEMVGLLLEHKIDAEKTPAGKTGVSVMVESADIARAIEILHENGLPRDKFNDIGTVFQKQGLISSPLEERARFIYAISQTISETLSQIDGVVTARVQVMVPDQHPLNDKPLGSSAAVFLKTKPGVNLEDKIPQIKRIVQNSVPGLAYGDIVVALFEASPPTEPDTEGPPMTRIMGINMTQDSMGGLVTLIAVAAILLILAIAGNAFFFLRLRKAGR